MNLARDPSDLTTESATTRALVSLGLPLLCLDDVADLEQKRVRLPVTAVIVGSGWLHRERGWGGRSFTDSSTERTVRDKRVRQPTNCLELGLSLISYFQIKVKMTILFNINFQVFQTRTYEIRLQFCESPSFDATNFLNLCPKYAVALEFGSTRTECFCTITWPVVNQECYLSELSCKHRSYPAFFGQLCQVLLYANNL